MAEQGMSVEILKQIRDELRTTRVELSELIIETNQRLDRTNERLGCVEGAVLELAEQQRSVVRWLKAGGQRDRHLARELDLLKLRVDALEARREP